MQVIAPSGSIAITEDTRRLVEGYFQLRPRGPTRVKGLSEPVEVYEVTGLGPLRTRLQRAVGRGLTRFVGREHEMETLKRALEQSKAGHGQVVAATADPGVGKSRLFYEFKAVSHSGCMVLEAYSVSTGKASAYLPVIEMLREYFEIGSDDDDRKRRERILGKVLGLDRTLEDTLPYFYSLYGIVDAGDPLARMDPNIRRRRTLEAVKRVLLRESLNQPLIVIFEDLHWIDSETQALLNLLVDAITNARILLLVNYRPEYHHEWGGRTHYTQLRLDPLGGDSAADMLSALLGSEPELGPLKRLIADRTEGNPFFVEEMVQALFEQGVIERNGTVTIKQSLGGIRVPPTVQALLASRIDRLPPDDKAFLQTLAVLGREFTMTLIRRLTGSGENELEGMLGNLQRGEFIDEQPAFPDTEYSFRHALTQEVAYNSILSERRKQFHERAALAIEALFELNLADHYADLAQHYQRSGNTEKTVNYLRLAAEQAMSRSAYTEAKGQLMRAVELIQALPETVVRDRTEIVVRLHLALCWGIGTGENLEPAISVLERARELCDKIGDDDNRLRVVEVLAYTCNLLIDRQEQAFALDKELLATGERLRDPEVVGSARFWLGYFSFYRGSFHEALEELDRVRHLSTVAGSLAQLGTLSWRLQNHSIASVALWAMGYPERASARIREGRAAARETQALALDATLVRFYSGILSVLSGDANLGRSQLDEAVSLAIEHDFRAVVPWYVAARGWSLVRLGEVERGLSEILQYKTEVIKDKAVFAPWFFVFMAEAYLASGRVRVGVATVEEALALSLRTGTQVLDAELLRLKGELLSLAGASDATEALEFLRGAIAVARRQGAKSWELRATTSLARLLTEQGRREEARAMLGEIYNWFTEGFDTADLKDAKVLLDELSG
jgi:tetratricopeptide (TPR) repeat protein